MKLLQPVFPHNADKNYCRNISKLSYMYLEARKRWFFGEQMWQELANQLLTPRDCSRYRERTRIIATTAQTYIFHISSSLSSSFLCLSPCLSSTNSQNSRPQKPSSCCPLPPVREQVQPDDFRALNYPLDVIKL